jgi:hypothetical protein
MRAAMTWRWFWPRNSASSRTGFGSCRTRVASTTMLSGEEVSSGVNSIAAPAFFRSSPAEATVTCCSCASETSSWFRLSPWRLYQAT